MHELVSPKQTLIVAMCYLKNEDLRTGVFEIPAKLSDVSTYGFKFEIAKVHLNPCCFV